MKIMQYFAFFSATIDFCENLRIPLESEDRDLSFSCGSGRKELEASPLRSELILSVGLIRRNHCFMGYLTIPQ